MAVEVVGGGACRPNADGNAGIFRRRERPVVVVAVKEVLTVIGWVKLWPAIIVVIQEAVT